MKKWIILALMSCGLSACNQSPAPKEDGNLKEAYSACINAAEGNPDKVEACQSVLDVLKKDARHKQFTDKETVNILDYRACLDAKRQANDEAVKTRCDKVWQEIRSNNSR
ncbi:hypothetical protein RJ498_001098 [Pluralibacter gergoviae]